MKHVRVPGRRLTAVAVAAVLAATGGVLAVPAAAAPVGAFAADEQQTAVTFPLSSALVSAGESGFLTRKYGEYSRTWWTPYAGASSTSLPVGAEAVRGGGSDVVVTGDQATNPTQWRVVKVHDMATGAAPVEIDLNQLGANYTYRGNVGAVLVVAVKKTDGTLEAHLVSRTGEGVSDRVVTGLPEGMVGFSMTAGSSGTAALTAFSGTTEARVIHRVAVDVTAGAVTDTYPTTGRQLVSGAVSATHLAWPEESPLGIVVAKRGSTETQRFPLRSTGYNERFGLVGDWLVSGLATSPGSVDPLDGSLVARSLTDSGASVRLMDRVSSLVPGPNGTLLVRGGTADRGEGLYRIAPGADGRPTAELVSAPGDPITAVLGSEVPQVVDFDRSSGVDLKWRLSHGNAKVSLTLTHKLTGESVYHSWTPAGAVAESGAATVGWTWRGEFQGLSTSVAPNGEYTWQLEVFPTDTSARRVRETGTLTVVRKPASHDYSDNGTPDIFARDKEGRLWKADTSDGTGGGIYGEAREVDSGWGIYDRIESVGDVSGSTAPDTIARDLNGGLWLFRGTGLGRTPLESRTPLGGGWNTYDQLAGGSDLTGEGRADLVAFDKAGDLWLYKGVGSDTSLYEPRKKIGWGWGIYNQITAVGNVGGAPAGDLLARDKDGVLWLYPGKGDGTFASRVRLGGGWNAYTRLVGIGDANKDGKPDLYAYGPDGSTYLYRGTGDASAPFAPRVWAQVYSYVGDRYDEVF
ncbi:FG-GAP-like repeat-containing protein [Streptomyces sp. NPDC015346]|uniref:FG-GAP repeat domain-containing protein n=1 Tax=Streptomyces sp. NPDC015346 TaxID=3364954 RepID=UPI0036F5BAE1